MNRKDAIEALKEIKEWHKDATVIITPMKKPKTYGLKVTLNLFSYKGNRIVVSIFIKSYIDCIVLGDTKPTLAKAQAWLQFCNEEED